MEIEIDQTLKPLQEININNGDEQGKSSNFQVAVNLFKSSLGIGFLALPYCFHNAGILLSIFFMLIIAALTMYTVNLIIYLADVKGLKETDFKQLYIDYVGKGPVMYFQICMAINYFGVGITYVIFFIDFFKNAFKTTGVLYSLLYGVLSLIVIIPLSLIRKLEFFTKYSFLANVLSIAVLIIIIQYPIQNFDIDNEKNYADIIEIPGLLGVAIFAFVSPGLVIPMRNSMRNKEAFKPTFLINLIVVFFIYVAFAIICCYGFGKNGLTQNILKGFGSLNEFYLMVQGFYALALVLTYPMQISPLIEVIENIEKIQKFLEKNQRNCFLKNIVRIMISLLIFPFGIFISKFADFINLLGAFCFIVIQFIYPVIAYNICRKDRITRVEKNFNYFIIFISIVGVGVSSYSSIASLMAPQDE